MPSIFINVFKTYPKTSTAKNMYVIAADGPYLEIIKHLLQACTKVQVSL